MEQMEDVKWLHQMGFQYEITTASFKQINAPRTAHIWTQLLGKIKPKEDVSHCRTNIVIERLKQKPLHLQNNNESIQYPLAAIVNSIRCDELKHDKMQLERQLNEMETEIDFMVHKNNRTYIIIGQKQNGIDDICDRIYLLNEKQKMLERHYNNLTCMQALVKNVTPVDREKTGHAASDVEEVLQKCADKLEMIVSGNSPHGQGVHERNSVFLENLTNKSTCKMNTTRADHKPNNRESLGLLPKEYTENVDDYFDGVFLTSSPFAAPYSSAAVIEKTSVQTEAKRQSIITTIHRCEDMRQLEEALMHSNNRHMILETLRHNYSDLVFNFRKLGLESSHSNYSDSIVNKNDMNEMYLCHVRNCLEAFKYQHLIAQSRDTVSDRRNEYCKQRISHHRMSDRSTVDEMNVLQLQMEDANLKANCDYLKRSLVDCQQGLCKESGLQEVLFQIEKTNNQNTGKRIQIEVYIENAVEILKAIEDNRISVFENVRRLGRFVVDSSWANKLLQDEFSREARLFQAVPLAYCKKSWRHIPKTVVPSFVDVNYNKFELLAHLLKGPFKISEDILLDILDERKRTKQLLKESSGAQRLLSNSFTFQDSPETLQLAESSNNLDRLQTNIRSLCCSPEVQKGLSFPVQMSQYAQLRSALMAKNHICRDRFVDGRDFTFYDNLLLSLCP